MIEPIKAILFISFNGYYALDSCKAKILKNKLKSTMIESGPIQKLLRYGVSSALALAVDFGLLLGLHHKLGLDYLAAAAIGFSCGCIITYLCSRFFVFDNNSERSDTMVFILFESAHSLSLLISAYSSKFLLYNYLAHNTH